tara:strand:+ start:1666 stop:2298 length:633 start_codon:yes stop_codon:yes gene_type:complete
VKGARKNEAPPELTTWLALANADWQPSYPFNEPAVRTAVVHSLFFEQRGLCVYCGRGLDLSSPGKSFHIEHFRPQHGANGRSDLEVSHTNLFLSCGQQDQDGNVAQTCGTRKGDWFDEINHVVPNYPDCTGRFKFMLSGHVEAAHADDAAARAMIKQLQLDHPELVKDRETTLALLDADKLDLADFWDVGKQVAESFGHIAYQHCGSSLP